MKRFFIIRLFIVYTLLQIIIQRFVVTFDQAGRIPLILLVIIIFQNYKDPLFRKAYTSSPVVFYLLWCVYSFMNWKLIGLYDIENMQPWVFVAQSFILPVNYMAIVYYMASKENRRITIWILVAFVLYIIAGNVFQDRGTGSGTGWSARGGLILGNRLPLCAMVMSFVAVLAYIKTYITKKYVYAILALALFSIMWIATRKAFGGFMIIILFYVLTQIDYKKPKNILLLLSVFFVLYIGTNFLFDHSTMGERMNEIEEQGERFNDTDNPFLNFVGDRAAHYIMGWNLFLDSPINGIGLRNFQILTDYPVQLHTEYMVQICENGIVGTVLYLLFTIGMLRLCIRAKRCISDKIGVICLGGMVMILFVSFTSWIYDTIYYFAVYGLVLASCKPLSSKYIKS